MRAAYDHGLPKKHVPFTCGASRWTDLKEEHFEAGDLENSFWNAQLPSPSLHRANRSTPVQGDLNAVQRR